MTKNIVEAFDNYFTMVEATTPELMEEVYKLRYQVFCLETGFLEAESYPDGLERDEFDSRSEHYLIQHKASGSYAATTRLILPDFNDPEKPFPIEQHSRFDRMDLLQSLPRTQIAEVSRFCVSKKFKRRSGESGTLAGVSGQIGINPLLSDDERRTFPHITLALLACLERINVRHGSTHWYVIIEPALKRFFQYFGLNVTPLGPATDYHGQRIPCLCDIRDQLDGIKKRNLELWNLFTSYGRFSSI